VRPLPPEVTDFARELLTSDFFAALAGAVVGGAIALMSSIYFEWQRELSHRRNLATRLAYRITLLTSELGNIRNQICGSISAARRAKIEEINLWASAQALIGVPDKAIEINSDELGWMHRKEHVQLSMDIIQLIRDYNLAVALMNRYNRSREEIEAATAEHANFKFTSEGIVGDVGFDIRQYPNLFRMILTTNNLLLGLEKTLNEANEPVAGIIERLNAAMPTYFPKKYFKLKLQLIDEGIKEAA